MSRLIDDEKVGSFKIVEKIGEGGMAIIFKATQPALKRTVVIKKLKDPNREIIERFKKEAFVSASLSQENVLAIYDFIYTGRSYYLVMEYVNGKDLRTLIDNSAPLPCSIAALIIRDVARGLEYTHSKNIIHRDIKPSNIIISFHGDVKLIDFGVAKDETPSKLTLTGMIVGTPSYMSPEQANGDRLGRESDIYSLGVLLYEMITGTKPFTGDTNTEILMKIVKGKFPSPRKYNRDIPARLVRIIKKAMKKDINKRYSNAPELIRALNKFIPWYEQSHKKEILSKYIEHSEGNNKISSSQLKLSGMKAPSTNGFWFTVFFILIFFVLGVFQLYNYISDERLVRIDVKTNVANCSVFLDDKLLGRIEGTQKVFSELDIGTHLLKIINEDNNAIYQTNIKLLAGNIHTINANLPTQDIYVNISTTSQPSGAAVYLDNQLLGRTPLQRMVIKSGKHHLKINKEGYLTLSEDLNFDQNQSYHFHFSLDRESTP